MQGYDRRAATAYARRWALGRNPAYYNFAALGGDCTNFVSQCLYAGSGIMNYTPVTGWYYRSAADRTASWTGVEFLYRFLTENRGSGPFGRVCSARELRAGDVIQLGDGTGQFYHCLLVLHPGPDPRVAAHDVDSLDRPLSDYAYAIARYLRIEGVRG